MSPYAQNTSVASERTQAELQRLLVRYGADQFLHAWDSSQGRSVIGFRIANRQVRIGIEMPDDNDPLICQTPTGRSRVAAQIQEELEREERRRWRSLFVVIKAKLVAVEDGISTIEREFLADVILPNGKTIAEAVQPAIAHAYETGQMPELLPGAPHGVD